MRSVVDNTLREQSERYAFRFTCEHCVHFAPATERTEEQRCSLGFPCAPHCAVDLSEQGSIEFCKSFELG